jgi:hypothetical protein
MRSYLIIVALVMLPLQRSPAAVIFDAPIGNSISGPRAFGQTFKAPASDPVLHDFTVWIQADVPTDFNFKIAAWDTPNSQLIPPLLHTSPSQQAAVESIGWVEMTFTPNITLTPGISYIAILDNSDFAPPNGLDIGGSFLNAYPDGAFAFPPFTIWHQWIEYGNGQDLAFRATFVPEPATLTWILAATLCVCRRRRIASRKETADA